MMDYDNQEKQTSRKYRHNPQ